MLLARVQEMSSRTLSILLSLAALVAVAGPSTAARACEPPACFYDTGRWTTADLANADEIPTDGVLVVTGTRWGGGVAEAEFGAIEVKVERGGVSVAGTLEGLGLTEAFAWRPAEALVPGIHEVTLTIDNDGIDPGAPDGECGPATLEALFVIEVVDETSPAPAAPYLTIDATVVVDGSRDLDDYICCDGAFPYEVQGSCDLELSWDEGRCASLRVDAGLRGWFERVDDEPALLAGALMYQLIVDGVAQTRSLDGVLRHDAAAPFCALVEVKSLATGAVAATEERCYGQHLGGPLGALTCDPTAELADCSGEPYRCENVGGEWDPQQCNPWDGVVDPDAVDCGFGGPTTEGTTTGFESTGDESSGDESSGDASTGDASTGDASTGDASTGDASSSDGSSGTTDEDDDGRGCGCDAGTAELSSLAWLVLLGVPRRRRRPERVRPAPAELRRVDE